MGENHICILHSLFELTFNLREVVRAVPRVLSKATPCDELFAVLRNEVFQHSLFLAGEQLDSERVPWPHVSALALHWF